MTGRTIPALPAPFENAYFRERALKVAARQKQGAILVSGASPDNRQGLPLPCLHDVTGLWRGSYSYDYECEWGRFKYEYERSSYIFTPHNGQFPPGWERYDLQAPIQPVIAVIDRAQPPGCGWVLSGDKTENLKRKDVKTPCGFYKTNEPSRHSKYR